MTHSTDPSGDRPDSTTHDDETTLGGGSAAAQRRRRALQEFLLARQMSFADLARSLGLATANAFYNFTNGRSDCLSLPMIERILDAYPAATFEELTGRPGRSRAPARPRQVANWVPHVIVVRMEARAGQWRRSAELPQDRLVLLPLPQPARSAGADAFGVVVAAPGAEQVYPVGALLVVRPYKGRGHLPEGTRVIVHRHRGHKVEVTVRETRFLDGALWLASCSTEMEHQEPLRPTPPPSRRQAATDVVDIAGVVVWALVPEKGIKPD